MQFRMSSLHRLKVGVLYSDLKVHNLCEAVLQVDNNNSIQHSFLVDTLLMIHIMFKTTLKIKGKICLNFYILTYISFPLQNFSV